LPGRDPQAAAARASGVIGMTARPWDQTWAWKGGPGLKAGAGPGRKPRLDYRQLARMGLALRRGAPARAFATDL
jgi:hypothetical protein